MPTAGGLPCHTARITMRNLIKRLFCRHSDGTTFVRNISGDEINTTEGKRSAWRCRRCDGLVLMDELHQESPPPGQCPNVNTPRACWKTVCQLGKKCRDPVRKEIRAQGPAVDATHSAAPASITDDAWTNPLNPLSPLSPFNPLHSSPAHSPCPAPASESPSSGGMDYGSSSGSCDSSSYSSDSGSSSSSDW